MRADWGDLDIEAKAALVSNAVDALSSILGDYYFEKLHCHDGRRILLHKLREAKDDAS